MVSINLNIKQVMAISNELSKEEFGKAIEQFDKKDFIEYLKEQHKLDLEDNSNEDFDDGSNEFR